MANLICYTFQYMCFSMSILKFCENMWVELVLVRGVKLEEKASWAHTVRMEATATAFEGS